MMMFRPGTGEIILIIVALLLLFGAKRIPDLARSVGQALHMFRKGMKEGIPDSDKEDDDSGNGEDANGHS
ncbi:MAG: twin-arginine translocase TatA/TatE family subunit [Candidatus Fermentibacteraceae bacterium]|nr:twin-arginine translocase TatA/TatE family subunit [Candidatus Fermentibacteraceae bacterium]